MGQQKRKQFVVDRKLQGTLMARVLLYWAFCIFMVTLSLIMWRYLTGPVRDIHVQLDALWFDHKVPLIATLLLAPILMIDTMRFSNRIAGPMARLRNSFQQIAEGGPLPATIKFRQGDFWQEFAEMHNQIVARIERLEQNAELSEITTSLPTPAGGESFDNALHDNGESSPAAESNTTDSEKDEALAELSIG